MDFDFSVTNNPVPAAPLALRTVYHIHSDPSYDVKKKGVQNRDIVALRTTGGLGKVKIAGCDEIAVLPGTLLFFEHAKVVQYYCADENWDFWWFEFSTNEILNLPMNKLLKVDAVDRESDDCFACLELLGKSNTGTTRLASATFTLLFDKWLLHIELSEQKEPHREAVENAIIYMKTNYSRPVSVQSLASMAGLCERRFRQVFIQVTGTQPKKYQEALRISLAEELLLNTPCTINEISIRLGYSSQFHFCQAFRKLHRMPPSQFRLTGRK